MMKTPMDHGDGYGYRLAKDCVCDVAWLQLKIDNFCGKTDRQTD